LNCYRARELASEALDGALASSLAERFRAHLGECPSCRAFYAELRESLALLSELPEVTVDDRFDEAVWARVRAGAPHRSTAWSGLVGWRESLQAAVARSGLGAAWRWAPLGAAAALLAVFALSSSPSFDRDAGIAQAPPARALPTPTPVVFGAGPADGGADVATAAERIDETLARMPQAVEVYLRSSSRDLRLETNGERLRRSDYSYPIRRVGSRGVVREGPGGTFTAPLTVQPVSDPGAALISF
jgi:hypothetical protein